MRILRLIYKKVKKKDPPYYFNYSVWTIVTKPIRKWIANVVTANCPFNCIRIFLYRLCGFKIGKGTFIGMRCYLDDMCYKLLTIGNNVTISYGVFFSCHGRNQGHLPITIEDNAYIGMRANVLSKNPVNAGGGITIGRNAVIGAATLVNKDVPAGMTAVGVPCKIIEAKSCVKDISKERCQQHDELEILQPCDDTRSSSERGTGFDEHKG